MIGLIRRLTSRRRARRDVLAGLRMPGSIGVRVAAGGTHAVRHGRRGSVLVLVLGTLALMSVLAVLFAAVGRSDKRTSAAADRRKLHYGPSEATVPNQVRDYISGIVAADALATFASPEDLSATGQVRYGLRRETIDFPSTDAAMLSSPQLGAPVRGDPAVPLGQVNDRRFRPEGSFPALTTFETTGTLPASDPRRDPVNTLTISWRSASDPWLATDQPENLTVIDDIVIPPPAPPPDIPPGATPDFFNRRDYRQISCFAPDGRAVNLFNLRNNFDIDSGVGPNTISANLTLFDFNLRPQSSGGPTVNATQQTWDGRDADPNVPADWFSFQRGMAIATTDRNFTWSDAAYPPYQYADADGDGIFDSRWQELVDATILGASRNKLISDGSVRYFFAFKAIDLSGKVNVNTAGDFVEAPIGGAPVGLTPGEVDLRRLLTGEDIESELVVGANPFHFFEMPRDGAGAIDTNSPQNYRGLTLEDRIAIGARAFDFLEASKFVGVVPPRGINETTLGNYLTSAHDVNGGTPGITNYVGTPAEWRFGPIGRHQEYLRNAQASQGASISQADGNYRNAYLFGEGDLLELLTFNRSNDARVQSKLEAAIDGRFSALNYVGVLRSNREYAAELGDRDNHDEFQRLTAPDSDADWDDTDADAYWQLAADTRQHLTTISGARPLFSSVVPSAGALSSAELRQNLRTISSSPAAMFRVYADGLLPYSGIEGAWQPTARPELGTLAFGYRGHEFALRTAAHLAVNFADSLDADGTPSVYTLLVDDSFRASLESDNPTDPSARTNGWSSWMDPARLDLGEPRIANASGGDETPMSRAAVMYGIERQPFLTELGVFFMYTDAPIAAGGDDEEAQGGGAGPGPGPGPRRDPEVTIDSRISEANHDALAQFVGIQITNPFDEPITLGDAAGPAYYLEFNGKFYSLNGIGFALDAGGKVIYAEPDNARRTPQPVTLGAGATKTFFFASQPLPAMQGRWDKVDPTGVVLPNAIDVVGAFVRNQIAAGRDVANMILIDEITNLEDLRVDSGPTPRAEQFAFRNLWPSGQIGDEIRMWRVLRPTGDDFPADGTLDNIVENDQLVDRMKYPSTAALDRTLRLAPLLNGSTARGYKIRNALARKEADLAPDNFNRGLTLITYASVRRKSDSTLDPNTTFAFPGWCIEGRWTTDWNGFDKDKLDPLTSLDRTYFQGGRNNCFFTFSEFLSKVVNRTAGPPNAVESVVRLHQNPELKDLSGSANLGQNQSGLGTNLTRIELPVQMNRNVLRVADALAVMGIGPSYSPDPASPNTVNYDRWMTLGEALAIATDQSSPPATTHPLAMYARAGAQPNPTTARPAANIALIGPVTRGPLDRGGIALDSFVPHVDAAPASPRNHANAAEGDVVFGLGMTPAMRVLDQLTVLGEVLGDLTFATPGVVNINTAPRPVLRTLPMLTPTAFPLPGQTQTSWWWRTAGQHDSRTDLASAVLAFRDKKLVTPRAGSGGPNNLAPANLDFSDGRSAAPDTFGGRANANYISGQREVLGFFSPAELLAVRQVNPLLTQGDGMPNRNDFDRLGTYIPGVPASQAKSTDQAGVEPFRRSAGGDDGLANDYDEQLEILNGVLGSTTTRSDYFAVWFVMHGYTREDVEGLAPTDPILPTIARRFLLVLDRSAVTRPGDSPRVVLFKELPVSGM
ncbi:MAG: hypothetical protein IT439_03240 [Phycisphaerales bacterium]|nr:hypothetical protein [Phycisphaerales bacterium]